uniref:PH domain-containing protein n=1 Tax=Wuchereria bancrofti TaxID=6293 RepID=A0AAF5PPG1_WUCBA
MEAEDVDLERIVQRAKERKLLIEKENALLDCKLESTLPQTSTELVISHPLLNRNKEESIHSIYPTEELELMKRISLDDSRNQCSDSLNDDDIADKSCNKKLRARFAALAADVENFECDMKSIRSKKSFLKGPSPRLSGGDMSPTVLFTPTLSYYPPASVTKLSTSSLPRINEGKPVCTLNDETIAYADESFDKTDDQEKMAATTVVYRQSESSKSNNLLHNVSEKHLRFVIPAREFTEDSLTEKYPAGTQSKNVMTDNKKLSEFNAKNCSESEEYGIHKFFRRKTSEEPLKSLKDNGNSCNKRNRSESKLSKGAFSVSSRNDIIDEITAVVNNATATVSVDGDKLTHTKQMAKQFDEKIREERLKAKAGSKISVVLSKFERSHSQSVSSRFLLIVILSCLIFYCAVLYLSFFREQNLIMLKLILVSSITGTPLHPDRKEDELLQAAMRMAKSFKQRKMRPQSYCETKSSVQISDFRPISTTCSVSSIQPAESILQDFAVNNEHDAVQEEISKVKISDKSNNEPNQLIDDAFQFIHRTPDRNSSLMSAILSTPEICTLSSPTMLSTGRENVEAVVPLAHSVSFYRRKEKENRSGNETVMLGQFNPSPFNSTTALNRAISKANMNDRVNFEIERARLEKAISVQQEQIVQASRALSFCHSTQEFRGSREEVDAQRALLIATERRRALIFVLDRLIQKHATGGVKHSISDGPKGNLTFSDISVKLMRDFVNGHINYHDEQLLFYFIVLIRHEETVHHTTLTTSDEGICSGRLEFPHYIQFRSLPHDFSCTLEIFALRTRRELLRHETKYHIKSGNSLKKSQKSMFSPGLVSLGGPSAVIDPSFQRVGRLSLNISSVNKNRFHLSDTLYPLDGVVEMKVRCYAEDCGTVGHKGFLSLYQPVENIASWARFWCVLWDGQLRFWRYPEDESTKIPVVSIDLRTCACSKIKPIPVERCPYPNSMQIDVWLPSNCAQKPDRIRILMAADRKDEMHSWLNAMNISLRNLTLWSCPS